MSAKRIFAIGCIYALAFFGWMFLGNTVAIRTAHFSSRMGTAVYGLWGTPLIQKAPSFSVRIPGTDIVRWMMPSKNEIKVDMDLEYRKKGLIWHPTYFIRFDGMYTVTNTESVVQKILFHFDFPDKNGTYDEFSMSIDGNKRLTPVNTREGIGEIVELPPGQSRTFRVVYQTRGIGVWRYSPDRNTGRIQNLNLFVQTNFTNVDYPDGSISPMSAVNIGEGMALTWKATDLITQNDFGVVVPEKLNPGPLVSRITFFAPVCLLFFFVLVASINITHDINIHPMHYLFVASGFFAFHLLLAYVVDHLNIHLSFLISAVVSVVLVTAYLSSVFGKKLPIKLAVGGQIFYLVLFSYSFFIKGYTGLTVSIGSVLTLAVLMKVTAKTNWEEVFSRLSPPPLPFKRGAKQAGAPLEGPIK